MNGNGKVVQNLAKAKRDWESRRVIPLQCTCTQGSSCRLAKGLAVGSERLSKSPRVILSDDKFELCDTLGLPTFEVDGMRLVKRVTMIVRGGLIEHVFYPVFPPNESAYQVIR